MTLSPASAATEFSLVDYADETVYDVSITDGVVNIRFDNSHRYFDADEKIVACSVYDGEFSLMSFQQYDYSYYMTNVYRYNINTADLSLLSFNIESVLSPYSFASDIYGNYYFVDSTDSSVLHCYKKSGHQFTLDCVYGIKQLMCIDGYNILAITTNGIYSIKNNSLTLISNLNPSVPCYYTGEDYITDSSNVKYNYNNGYISPIVEETDPAPEDNTEAKPEQDTVGFQQSGEYIYVDMGTTVAKLRKALGLSKESFSAYKTDGTKWESGKLGTGMKVKYNAAEYTIIIYGELTREGNINSRDLKLSLDFVTGKETPDKIDLLAGDVNADGRISIKDSLLISWMY